MGLTAASGQTWSWPWVLAGEPTLVIGAAGLLALIGVRSVNGPAPDGGRVLQRAGPGYRLRPAAGELDLHVFRRLHLSVHCARGMTPAPLPERECGFCCGQPSWR